jgi:hypothetical protein
MDREPKLEIPGIWYEVDFHVHSPGSHDFQGIGKDDSGYIWLLKQANNAKLDIIVITDHNEICGYHNICEIENDLRRTQKTLERNKSTIPNTILEQIALFDQVVVLPGVELDAYPNVHVIVIFDPQRVDEISPFLDKAGYIQELRGTESSSRYGKWNFEETLMEAEKINAIVIAAHVDSNKGLYNVSKEWGQNRITAFSNDNLFGMEYINPINRDKIENILKSPDYSRNTHLAFVQSSDFHGNPNQSIGDRRTYVRIDCKEKNNKSYIFNNLRKALRNPDEFISSPERPEVQAILKRLDDKPAVENVINETEIKRLLQYICSYSNSEDGTIIIGRNSNGNWVGEQEKSEEEYRNRINNVITKGITPIPNFTLQVYPYFGNNYIATIRVRKHPRLCIICADDSVYCVSENHPVRASTNEIIDMAEGRFIDRYSHLSITTKLSDISQKLMGTGDSIDILPIVRKMDKITQSLWKVFLEPEFGSSCDDDLLENINFPGNGFSDGNIIVLTPVKPRFQENYLRISAPIGELDLKSPIDISTLPKFTGEKIIIAPGGGVYYDSHNDIRVICEKFPPLIYSNLVDNNPINIKFLTAYLKSSIAIWYADRCLGSCDLRRPLIQKLPIPENVDTVLQIEVCTRVDQILEYEREFLRKETDLLTEFNTPELQASEECTKKSTELVTSHNRKADAIMGELDNLFYLYFGFSSIEIEIVERMLKSSDFAIFPGSSINE